MLLATRFLLRIEPAGELDVADWRTVAAAALLRRPTGPVRGYAAQVAMTSSSIVSVAQLATSAVSSVVFISGTNAADV